MLLHSYILYNYLLAASERKKERIEKDPRQNLISIRPYTNQKPSVFCRIYPLDLPMSDATFLPHTLFKLAFRQLMLYLFNVSCLLSKISSIRHLFNRITLSHKKSKRPILLIHTVSISRKWLEISQKFLKLINRMYKLNLIGW